MADTYTLISSVTVGAGGASSIDFTSIPATYTDLVLKVSTRGSAAQNNEYIKLNNSSASAYSDRSLYGQGSSAASATDATNTTGIYGSVIENSGYTANTFSSSEYYIPNYAGSTNKSTSSDSVQENNASTAYSFLVAGLWANTAAINQITLYPSSGTFVQYSTAYLYGIKNS